MLNSVFRRGLTATLSLGLLGVVLASQPAAAASNPARDRLGFYPEYGGTQLPQLEAALGRPINVVAQYGDMTPGKLSASVWGEVVQAGKLQTRSASTDFVLSVPLAFATNSPTASTAGGRAQIGSLLDEVANGRWDSEYRQSGQYLVNAGYPKAILRLGWEMNWPWFPWSSVGNEGRYVRAYRHVAQVFRSVSPNFRFDWAPLMVPTKQEWDAKVAPVYPGDDVVDYVGSSVYDKCAGGSWNSSTRSWNDPAAVWNSYFLPGLKTQRDFAIAHGKAVSFPE